MPYTRCRRRYDAASPLREMPLRSIWRAVRHAPHVYHACHIIERYAPLPLRPFCCHNGT